MAIARYTSSWNVPEPGRRNSPERTVIKTDGGISSAVIVSVSNRLMVMEHTVHKGRAKGQGKVGDIVFCVLTKEREPFCKNDYPGSRPACHGSGQGRFIKGNVSIQGGKLNSKIPDFLLSCYSYFQKSNQCVQGEGKEPTRTATPSKKGTIIKRYNISKEERGIVLVGAIKSKIAIKINKKDGSVIQSKKSLTDEFAIFSFLPVDLKPVHDLH